MEDEALSTGLKVLGGGGATVLLLRLLITNWLKRAEEKFRAVHDLTGKVTALDLRMHNAERDLDALRVDVKEGMRTVEGKVDRLDEKFDRFLERFFGRSREDR